MMMISDILLKFCQWYMMTGLKIFFHSIVLQTKTDIKVYIYQRGDISTLNGSTLKLEDKFSNQGSSVSSSETDINTQLAKAWTAIDKL